MATSIIHPDRGHCLSGTIGKKSSKTFYLLEDSTIIYLSRLNHSISFLFSTDYWSSTYEVISGSLPPDTTITKSANTYELTVNNNRDYAMSYIQIR